jgi:hypothetical protein
VSLIEHSPGTHGRLIPQPFERFAYVPIILTRQGERLALRELDQDIREALTPLFVVHPVDRDLDDGTPKRSEEEHLRLMSLALVRDWGLGDAFVDLRHLDLSSPMTNGDHGVPWFIAACRSAGLSLAPAISGSHNPSYRAEAVRAAELFDTSLLLRLGPSEWPQLGTPLGDGHLASLIAETGRSPANLHLMLDLEDQLINPAIAGNAVRQALRSLPHAYEWASVTVAGTAMPSGTNSVGADAMALLPRTELTLWRSLTEPDYRHPSFGDYCVQHPDPLSGFDPRFMDSSAQLRYTIDSDWLVVRGRGIKRAGNSQVHDLALRVVNHSEFSGNGFSWGDHWLSQCAARSCSPGNQGVWRKASTNHHLTYVVRQIANHGAP